MSNTESSFGSFRTAPQSTSPQTKRNTKNLSLQLNRSNTLSAQELDFKTHRRPENGATSTKPSHSNTDINDSGVRSQVMAPVISTPALTTARSPLSHQFFVPTSIPASPSTFPMSATSQSIPIPQQPPQQNSHQMYRHPSISRGTDNNEPQPQQLTRRSTLSLAIPTDVESSKSSSGSKLSSTNSIPSFSSSSPTMSSPLVPATPKDSTPLSNYSDKRSSHSSTSTLKTLPTNGDVLKTQTLIRDLSSFQLSDEGDQSKMNAYPNGPACVLPPNLYLYSEPQLSQIEDYDLVVNVARELSPPLPHVMDTPPHTQVSHYSHNNTNYYYVPWTHTSKLCPDLPFLTDIISNYLQQGKKVLIHCQCGVSRSASLIVALFMKMNQIGVNEAYSMLKERAPEISPNMSLIFQLMEWGELIGVQGRVYEDEEMFEKG